MDVVVTVLTRFSFISEDVTFCVLDCRQVYWKNESRKGISKIARSLFDDSERTIHDIRQGTACSVESKRKPKYFTTNSKLVFTTSNFNAETMILVYVLCGIKQCFLVCLSWQNMAGNNVTWFVYLQETWLGNIS
jgi:hypothetical protein